jgi:hypothetical protein
MSWNPDALVANTIAGALGAAAFAVSFSHVRDVAMTHGQSGPVAYLVATSVELMAVAAVTEIRQRARRSESYAWPVCVLLIGVAMTLAANLATATPGVWGHVMAAWPAVAFLAVAVMIETRTGRTNIPEPDRADAANETRTAPARTAVAPYVPAPRTGMGARTDIEPRTSRTPYEGEPVRMERTAPERTGASAPASDEAREGEVTAIRTDRPSRDEVVAGMVDALRTDGTWRPDYVDLMARTGYGRSWLEKRAREARGMHTPTTYSYASGSAPIEHANGVRS